MQGCWLADFAKIGLMNEGKEYFTEVKAPDTGSIMTGEYQFDRDTEWL